MRVIGYVFLGTGEHFNDVEREKVRNDLTHKLSRRKMRAEFLLGPLSKASVPDVPCGIVRYPVLAVGGLILYVYTTYIQPCEGCGCVFLNWSLSLSCSTRIYRYDENGNRLLNSSSLSEHAVWSSPLLIDWENQIVCTASDRCYVASEALGNGYLNRNRRYIFEVEYISESAVMIKIIRDAQVYFVELVSLSTDINWLLRISDCYSI